MNTPLITVIVPVYNVEKYLKKCIDSIINQTYPNLEIILVDDGATDNSGAICDMYAARDDRIVVLHKENGGLSDARNAALDIAKGEYITLVDSDDSVTTDYVEYMHMLLIQNEADISACELKKVYADTDELDVCQENAEQFSGVDALEHLLYQKKVAPCAVCKLYKREIFEEIRYPKGIHYEDLATIYKVLHKCEKVVLGKEQKYYYYQRFNSIMNDSFNPKKMDRIRVANELKLYVDKYYPQLQPATSTRCFLAGLQVFREIPKNRKYKQYSDEAWKQIVTYRGTVVRNKKAKAATRIMAVSSYLGRKVLGLLGKVYSVVFAKSQL